jgi:hypothetical protein
MHQYSSTEHCSDVLDLKRDVGTSKTASYRGNIQNVTSILTSQAVSENELQVYSPHVAIMFINNNKHVLQALYS